MPELPEVETTVRGIKPYVENQIVAKITVRNHSLRWPVNPNLSQLMYGKKIQAVYRRAKYLIFSMPAASLIVHLGMSGSLRFVDLNDTINKHDHIDLLFDNQMILRYCDPRRFGAFVWTEQPINKHSLITHLGIEPMSREFCSDWLANIICNKKQSIKNFLMNSKIIVGVGNIYVSESLFRAGVHPETKACHLTNAQCDKLVRSIKMTLSEAIQEGGTTLKDFVRSDGKLGYFAQKLQVYGREGQLCFKCHNKIEKLILANRSTFYCSTCQVF